MVDSGPEDIGTCPGGSTMQGQQGPMLLPFEMGSSNSGTKKSGISCVDGMSSSSSSSSSSGCSLLPRFLVVSMELVGLEALWSIALEVKLMSG